MATVQGGWAAKNGRTWLRRSRELTLPLQSIVDSSPYACNAQRLGNPVSRNASLDQLADLLLEGA